MVGLYTLCLCAILFNVANCGVREEAIDGAYLDPPYPKHIDIDGAFLDPPYPKDGHRLSLVQHNLRTFAPASDVAGLIAKQTRVKSQKSRGTCSIFSATAMLESMLIITKEASIDIDYSEEWLQYAISPGKTDSGSSSYSNIPAIAMFGMPKEEEYPYIGEEWKTLTYSKLSKVRCGKVPSSYQASCLVGHRDTRLMKATDTQLSNPTDPLYDPDVLFARTSATAMKQKYLFNVSRQVRLRGKDQVLDHLNEGFPVLLDIDFYYGAWNHRTAVKLGIPRNQEQWDQGTVTYPEPGSKDRELSQEEPAGHSVLIVGYDNTIEVNNTVEMEDGSFENFTYSGVYIFKNSWGTGSFGYDFQYNNIVYDGYGTITMKYADELGRFFQMSL